MRYTLPRGCHGRRFIAVSVIASVLGLGAAGLAVADALSQDSTTPLAPDKPGAGPGPDFDRAIPPLPDDGYDIKESLRAAAPQLTAIPEAPEGAVPQWRETFPDTGPPEQVDKVKREVIEDLTLDEKSAALPAGAPVPTLGELQARLAPNGEAWASAVRAGHLTELASACLEAWNDPTYTRYDDARMDVTEWTGVAVTNPDHNATAVFIGHFSYLTNGAWNTTDDAQYHIDLVNERGHWRLATIAIARP